MNRREEDHGHMEGKGWSGERRDRDRGSREEQRAHILFLIENT